METDFKFKALNWANQFEVCCLLDSHQYQDPYGQYDWILAADQEDYIVANDSDFFNQLNIFQSKNPSYLFGFFGYDLKNQTEDLSSKNADNLAFPDGYFFKPKYLIASIDNKIEILINNSDKDVVLEITNYQAPSSVNSTDLYIKSKLDKDQYLERVKALKQHIARGDVYEITFCQEFFSENTRIDAVEIYSKLCQVSPVPFASYLKIGHKYILCASPERFLRKKGNEIISQPIKGTAKRSQNDSDDEHLKSALKNSLKEQSENVMIVDLVRNDLTKIAKQRTVKVVELFGIYSFPTVHQMISTISCQAQPQVDIASIIKNCFPMGSMTGAPKVKALELIEQYETTKRGAFSGSIGYISPSGDFDFNVVIRSILYNSQNRYLSFQVGGAITHRSNPELEFEECLLKAKAIFKVLSKA